MERALPRHIREAGNLLLQADLGADQRFAEITHANTADAALAAARIVGPRGRASAIAPSAGACEAIASRARLLGVPGVDTVAGHAFCRGGVPRGDGAFDLVSAFDLRPSAISQPAFFAEAARVLAPGGRLLLVEYGRGRGGPGPRDHERFQAPRLAAIARHYGFERVDAFDADAHRFALLLAPRA